MSSPLPKYFILALVMGIAVAAGWTVYLARPSGADRLALNATTLLDEPRALPEFNLVDQQNRAIRKADFHGEWRLLFFGFTHCPAICPNTMSLLHAVVTDDALQNVKPPQVVLITVDPQRDTPQRLASYLRNFNPDFTGLTGTPEQLTALRKALFVPLQKIQTEEGYTLDHGSALILINPDAEVAGFITPPHRVPDIVADLARIISNS